MELGILKIDTAVVVAVLTVAGSIIGAALSFYLTKRKEREAEDRKHKVQHYREFLEALSGVVVSSANIKAEDRRRWQNACNTISLVAPQSVLEALWNFQDAISASNPNKSANLHDTRLNELVLAIRADLGISPKDNPKQFRVKLWAAR
jgi:hypothetical protein